MTFKHSTPQLATRTGIEIPIERLDEQMDLFQNNKFVHSQRNADDKVEAGITAVHKLVRPLFNNVTHLGCPGQNVGSDISQNTTLFRFGIGRKEFAQSDLALPAHEDDKIKPHLRKGGLVAGFLRRVHNA